MGNIDNKEIEIQVQIENSRKLISFLKKEAKFIGKQHQIDKYFTPAHKNFTKVRPIKEWLRLRDSSGEFSINYKNWHHEKNGKGHFCDEYETKVEDMKQMENIFKSLNMKPTVTVDKIRKTYLYKNYEISIDSIKRLGDFVEIEYKGKQTKKSPKDITKEMVAFLKNLNCGKILINYVGYAFQCLFPKEVKVEEV